jgi:hypothetical protein
LYANHLIRQAKASDFLRDGREALRGRRKAAVVKPAEAQRST